MPRPGGHSQRIVGALLALTVLAGGCTSDEPTERAVDAPDTELVEQWWRWVGGVSSETDVMHDRDGSYCAVDQTEDGVWFLAGTYDSVAERFCAVPAGRPLLVPVIAKICDVGDGPASSCTVDPVDEKSATLDGAPLELRRVTNATAFKLGVGKGNPISPDGGIANVYADGWWARIDAPSVGLHDIVVTGEAVDFSIDLTYHLEITQE